MMYRITYYYLATGMEGKADERDCGIVEADSAEAAKRIVAEQLGRLRLKRHSDWIMGSLTAVEVKLEDLTYDEACSLAMERNGPADGSWAHRYLAAVDRAGLKLSSEMVKDPRYPPPTHLPTCAPLPPPDEWSAYPTPSYLVYK